MGWSCSVGIIALVALGACGSGNHNGGQDGGAQDGAAQDGAAQDGLLDSLVDGAEIDGALVDALPDVMPDAFIDAFPAAEVRVTVTRGTPVVGAPVVFRNADGSLASTAFTDNGGRALGTVTVGGSISVVLVGPPSTEVDHILGVAPGDDLHVGYLAGTSTLSAALPGGTTVQDASSTCGYGSGQGSTLQLVNTAGCTHADLFIDAHNVFNLGGEDQGSMLVPGLDMLPNTNIDLSAQTWQPATSFPHQVTGLDSHYHHGSAVIYQTTPTLGVYASAATASGAMYEYPLPPQSTLSATAKVPAFTPSDRVASTTFIAQFEGAVILGLRVEADIGTASSYSLDLSALDIARPTAFPDVDDNVVSWPETGGTADVITLAIDYTVDAGSDTIYHYVTAPHTGSSLTIPLLPPPYDVYNHSSAHGFAGIDTFVLTKQPGGYSAEKAATHTPFGLAPGERRVVSYIAGGGSLFRHAKDQTVRDEHPASVAHRFGSQRR